MAVAALITHRFAVGVVRFVASDTGRRGFPVLVFRFVAALALQSVMFAD
jgi:hypothetical protein